MVIVRLPYRVCLLAALIVLVCSVALAATVREVFREAVAAYHAGDMATARAKLELVLAQDPSHPAARAYLKKIEMEAARPQSIENRLTALMLTGVNFREATLESVFPYLSQMASEAGGPGVSFVVKLTREQMQKRRVTLALAQPVPFTEVLRYVGQLAHVRFRYETHAIVVEDAGEQPSPATP